MAVHPHYQGRYPLPQVEVERAQAQISSIKVLMGTLILEAGSLAAHTVGVSRGFQVAVAAEAITAHPEREVQVPRAVRGPTVVVAAAAAA